MSTYVLPQVQVFQSFTAKPTAVARPLRSHIAGGHAWLVRFAEADEQVQGRLGFYDSELAQEYAWPNQPAGSIIDQSFTKVWIKNALLRYYQTVTGVGSIGGSDELTKMPGYSNRIVSDVLSFAENTDTYPRSSQFLRDVLPGDIARVRAADVDDNVHVLWTSVKAVHGVELDPVVAAAVSDEDNLATQIADSSQSQIAGTSNSLTITNVDDSAYDGLTSGFVNETYDLLVTASSIGGDLTTATVRVISGSGTDDQDEINPSATGVPTEIGTRGLEITWTAGTPGDNLVAGQKWRVLVESAFTATTSTSGGTYTGDVDTTYVVEITTGGLFTATDVPLITVTTTNGVDVSGPTVVTATNTFIAIGNYGTTIKFNGTGLRKGDRFYVTVTAAAPGPMRILEFTNSFDPAVPDDATCDLELFILKAALAVPEEREGFAPQLNWEQTADALTVNDGVIAYDSLWAEDGVPEALPVVSEADQDYGELFVEYRAWRSDLIDGVFAINDVGLLDDQVPGALSPDNPLKWGLFQALSNNNGVDVKYTAVADPADADTWADVLGLLLGRTDCYGLVPLTRDPTVLALYKAHIDNQSSSTNSAWRTGWFNLPGIPEIPLVSTGSDIPGHTGATTSDGEVALATIDGTDNLTLTCTSNNAVFEDNEVAAGDVVRAIYTTDGFGDEVYSTFTIAEVVSQEVLLLESGPDAPVNVAAKFEVWRTLTADQEVEEIAQVAGSYSDRRIRAVWPDVIEGAGESMEGFHLCAALAALAGGILPHQGMTRMAVSGYDNVDRTVRHFTRSQLDILAGAGVFIVTQDPVSGQVYVRHAVTTAADQTDPQQREEMFVRNLDSVSFRFMEALGPFIGIANVTPGTISQLKNTLRTTLERLKTELQTATLGGQISEGSIVSIAADTVFLDKVNAVLSLTMPFAVNGTDLSLSI